MRGLMTRQAWRGAGMRLVCLALLIVTARLLDGQEASAASGSAQPVKRDFRFEVASVRPAEPPNGRNGIPPSNTSGRYRNENSLAGLAMEAFGVKYHFEIEYPGWMASSYFAVNAVFPEGATRADLPIMMQHLLEDRFGIVFHRETRQMAGDELAVAKSGVKLTKSAGPAPDKTTVKGPSVEVKNGVPQFTKDARSGQLLTLTAARWRGRNKTISDLAVDLARNLGAPVIDATGVEGEYDYDLVFTPEVLPLRFAQGQDDGHLK
jgi:uncharacterized protein (TIGR03435 family)